MRFFKSFPALLLLAAFGGPPASAALVPQAPYQPPFLPPSDEALLQEVPSTKDPAVAVMRDLRMKADAAPHDLQAAMRLANAYIDYSRQIGDAHYAGYAEAVIAPWTAQTQPPVPAILSLAVILQYRHQFADARQLLLQVFRVEPRNAQALLTQATLDMVQGDYANAAKGCTRLIGTAGLDLGVACMGNLRSYTGQAAQSLALLLQAEKSSSSGPAAYRAWVEGLISETAERLGNWSLAEEHYRAALKLLPQDNFLLVAYADFLLDRDRPADVLPLLADHAQSDTAFLRIALAESRLNAKDAGLYTWSMAARFEALKLRGSEFFGREEARFALALQHDADTSLSMAERNWQLQRAPWDARVLLEAALAAHKPQAAAAVLKFIDDTHLEDPIILPIARQLKDQLAHNSGSSR
jgi:Tfp pilus assembly protein PilF